MFLRLIIFAFCILLLPCGLTQAEVVFSSDFDNQAQVRRNWQFIGGVDFRNGPAAESGQALGFGPRSYAYRFFRQDSKPESMQVTFWFRVGRNDFSWSPNSRSRFYFYWYGNGLGGGWYTIDLHRGASGAGSIRTVTIDLPSNRFAKDNYILFYNSGSAGYFHVDNLVVTRNQNSQLDRFNISNASSSASVCVPHEFVIEARDSNNQLIPDYDGRVDITTSSGHGTWSMVNPNSRFNHGPIDSGQASYQFDSSDNGRLRLQLNNEHAQSLTVIVSENPGSISSTSNSIRFSENSFVVAYNTSFVEDVVAYRNHEFQISMMKRDDNGVCGVATNYNRSGIYVKKRPLFGDPGGISPQLLFNSNTELISNSFIEFPISFSQGIANVQLLARDVGHFGLDFEDRSADFSDSFIEGSSPDLSVRPFAFDVSVPGSGESIDPNGLVFQKAGSDFDVTVTAVGWQPSDDTNNDGIADGHDDPNPLNNADLSNNIQLPSFGAELLSYSLGLSSRSVAPLSTSHHDLTGTTVATAFTQGSSTVQVAYSNVGFMEIDLTFRQANYLSGSAAAARRILGRSGPVGRFIPDHFTVQNANLDPFCAPVGLTHLDQPFSVSADIRALGRDGRVVDGYHDSYAKLNESLGSKQYVAKPVSAPVLVGRVDVISETLQFSQGSATLSSSLSLTKTGSKEPPLSDVQLGLALTDTDNVSVMGTSLNLSLDGNSVAEYSLLGSSDFYFSRLYTESRHGPETQPLAVPFEVQSWTGHRFSRNKLDSCSRIERANVSFASTGALSIDSNLNVPIASANTLASFTDLQANHIRFEEGGAGLVFSPPGQRGHLELQVDYSQLPWLTDDWNQNLLADDTQLPNSVVRFGVPRGHDLLVYWRESVP